MEIFINHVKRAIIVTYPKVATSTIRQICNPPLGNISEFYGWKLVHKAIPLNEIYFDNYIDEFNNDYKIYLLYRDPVEKYISGFSYVIYENLVKLNKNLFYKNCEENIKYYKNISNDWYIRNIKNMLSMNYGMMGLNDIHLDKFLICQLALKVKFKERATLVNLNNINDIFNELYNKTNASIDDINSVQDGFGQTSDENELLLNKIILSRFKENLENILNTDELYKDIFCEYIKIEKLIYEAFENKDTDLEEFFIKCVNLYLNKLVLGNECVFNSIISNFIDFVECLFILRLKYSKHYNYEPLTNLINNWENAEQMNNILGEQ